MPTSDDTPTAPAWRPLNAPQRRVLGVLLEKAKTTPGAYPMTVNAIVNGCNQRNNRDPLSAYDDMDVQQALDELQTLGAVSEIDWLGRVPKYKHQAYEWLGVDRSEAAVMTELLLRGAQALGELRGRAARMEPIAELAALKPIVEALLARRLMIELTPPGRGQIVSHNLYPAPELAELRARYAGGAARIEVAERGESASLHSGVTPQSHASGQPSTAQTAGEPGAGGANAAALAVLVTEVAELRAEVARLRAEVAALEARLDASSA